MDEQARVFANAWYWCDLVDRFELESTGEPDWSRVPEAKRDQVRDAWQRGQEAQLKPQRVKLWGPQIPWYQRQPMYRVTVIARVGDFEHGFIRYDGGSPGNGALQHAVPTSHAAYGEPHGE